MPETHSQATWQDLGADDGVIVQSKQTRPTAIQSNRLVLDKSDQNNEIPAEFQSGGMKGNRNGSK